MRTAQLRQLERRIQAERRMLRGAVMTLRRDVTQRLTSPAGLVIAMFTQGQGGSAGRWLRLLPSLAALGLNRLVIRSGEDAGAPPAPGSD